MIKLKRGSIIQLMTRKKIIRNFNKIIINLKDNLNLNGDWGLGNPQSPIPNPQKTVFNYLKIKINKN